MILIKEENGKEVSKESLGILGDIDLILIAKLKDKGIVVKITDNEMSVICDGFYVSFLTDSNGLITILKTGKSWDEVIIPLKEYSGIEEVGLSQFVGGDGENHVYNC